MTAMATNEPRAEYRVDVSHSSSLNFAMEQAGVPVVSGVRILNCGASSAEGVEFVVRLEPCIAEAKPEHVGRLRPGESAELPPIDLQLTPGKLRSVLEAERAELVWALRDASGTLASGRSGIDVLAYNEWAGLRAPPALLATFVTPNAPAVVDILRRVRDHLRVSTSDPAISGYQSRSEARVRALVRALYETLQSFGISYIGAPASFEESGQKIRLPDMVVRECLANCLDVSVLVASCLEQMGLSPLLVIQRGHAFPGVWLIDERFHEGVVYDAARLRNAAALGQLAFFDSSSMVADPRVDLAVAERVATDALAANDAFLCAVDVAVARRDRYRPLPLRDLQDGPPTVNAQPRRDASDTARERRADGPVRSETLEDRTLDRAKAAETDGKRQSDALIADRFRKWREKLLDLSLRNKLLNFRRDAKGALALDVPDIARFEDLLASDTAFEVHPRPIDPRDQRDGGLVRAHGGEESRRDALLGDLGKGIVHSSLDESALLRSAIHLEREARTAMEEGGANVLYVVVGVLRWFESDSSMIERLAPLLLVPVSLEYMRKTRRLRVRHLPEESLPNWTLVEKLRTDFGLEFPALANIEPDDSGHDVPAMLRGVRDAIQRMKRWEVLDEAHLGLFSFTKHLMWRDLGDNAEALLKNDVIRQITTRSSEPGADRCDTVTIERLDDDVPPAQLPLVVDADSTQTAAVVTALRGRSFVLQGPPGTGKSQTITNLIAAAIAQGKTVLFVSEKMAALEVVYRRLQAVGLGDFCLELHSHKAQKREVVQALGRTLERRERRQPPLWDEASEDLADARARLNTYVRAIHAPTALGLSFHAASARAMTLAHAPVVAMRVRDASALTREQFRSALANAEAFAVVAAQVEPVASHPFRDSGVDAWSAQRDNETREAIREALAAVNELEDCAAALRTRLRVEADVGLEHLGVLAEVTKAAADGPLPAGWRDDSTWSVLRARVGTLKDASEDLARGRVELARRWTGELVNVDLADYEALFARWSTAFFLFAWCALFSARRKLAAVASRALPGNRQIAADLVLARQAKDLEARVFDTERSLRRSFEGCGSDAAPQDFEAVLERGEVLRSAVRRAQAYRELPLDSVAALADSPLGDDERSAYVVAATRVLAALSAYGSAAQRVRSLLVLRDGAWSDSGPGALPRARAQLTTWTERFADYRPWAQYQRARRELVEAGYPELADAHATSLLRSAECAKGLERTLLDAWVTATRDTSPVLRDFDGKSHHALVERFRKLDRAHLRDGRARVVALLEAALPTVGVDSSASTEPGILRRELAKKTRHMPLRKLLQQVPNLLVRLKPCLLMSPLSVAQYLPAHGRKFDIVVFDEASQICTHDAIGAIGRGSQVIVVGDSKQLPPTAFFQRAAGADDTTVDDNDFTELESILDEAVASGLPEQMLGWHYRSRHEALIEFSNSHYYDGRLNVFPAARGRVADLGVKFHRVTDGVYELGRSRTNPKEARALVATLVDALRSSAASERTFGIVTFSSAQQELIEDLLEEARRSFPEIEAHFSDEHPSFEKVFVKNLENVQGDERDEIYFSVAYGPDENRRMLMNFGPLNRDGGERRLNVAVTRARKLLKVFASITADDIDTSRTRSTGAKHLKAFLRFAAERSASSMARAEQIQGDFDSDFERDVYDVLRASGYRVDTQVGCGRYRIDLAVVHPDEPGVYAIGIECDGAAYHSGATARDRDRLRQDVLEGLGWQLHRIWSTDWIYNRVRETERLLDVIQRAVREGPRPQEVPRASIEPSPEVEAPVAEGPAVHRALEQRPEQPLPATPYRRAEVSLVSSQPDDLFEQARTQQVTAMIASVLRVEAPIHVEELARRIGAGFAMQRVSARARRRVAELAASVLGYSVHGDFVHEAALAGDFDIPIRTGGERDPDMLPPQEVAAAAKWVLSRAFSMPLTDLVRETARLFGIQRLGAKVDARMRAGVDLLVRAGLCTLEGERAVWSGSPPPPEGTRGET